MGAAEKSSGAPLPVKLAGLLREAKWLALVAVAAYLLLAFLTYRRSDPAWSHSETGAVVSNAGGVVGAWVADILLFLFGISAYWWIALCLYVVVWGYRRLDGTGLIDPRPLWIALAGFVALILSSASLEALRLYSLQVTLPDPDARGGVLGTAVGFSLVTGISWMDCCERVGGFLEALYLGALRAWERHQDRRLGELAREERDFVLEIERKREEDHPPLRIEPPVAQIKKSERVQKEKQAPLFENLPDTPLPPLKLLDEAASDAEQVSAETLEFTSRLIEKKLSDFGVSVKVIAAYPGPVITRYEIEPAVGVKGSQIVNLVKDLSRALSVVSI